MQSNALMKPAIGPCHYQLSTLLVSAVARGSLSSLLLLHWLYKAVSKPQRLCEAKTRLIYLSAGLPSLCTLLFVRLG